MYNIIIVNSDIKFLNKIINIVFPVNNIRIKSLYPTTNLESCAEIANPENIFILTEDTYLKFSNQFNNDNKIIVFTDDSVKTKLDFNILYISNNISDQVARKNLITFLESTPALSYEVKTQKILNNLNFDFTLKGTNYLYESLVFCLTNHADYLCENLQQNVFKIIAETHNTSANNVKWSIIRSINNMYNLSTQTERKKIVNYFKINDNDKPTPKRVICTLVNNLSKN